MARLRNHNATDDGNVDFRLLKKFVFKAWKINIYRVSHKKGVDKKLLFEAAQSFALCFYTLFCVSKQLCISKIQ